MIRVDLTGVISASNGEAFEVATRKMRFALQFSAYLVLKPVRRPWNGAPGYARRDGLRAYSPNNRIAFSFSTSGRTSSLMAIFSKSAIHRSGVISGKSDPNSIFFFSSVFAY